MHILTIVKGSEAFECNFEPFEPNLKHSNASSNHFKGIRMQIRTSQKAFEPYESKFEPFEWDSTHSNAYSNI